MCGRASMTRSRAPLSVCGLNLIARMHIDGLRSTRARASLLAGQFPESVDLAVRRIDRAGPSSPSSDSVMNSVRLPRRRGPTEPGSTEFDWLPTLAPLLPVEVPVPVRKVARAATIPGFGRSTLGSRANGAGGGDDAIEAARVSRGARGGNATGRPAGAPRGRGVPLADRDPETRYWLARFDGDPTVTAEWERALAAPPWGGRPVWHHGDLDVRNWLVRDGRVRGVIDWGAMGVGDPACDVMVAWKLHSPAALHAFRAALPTDDATWGRARGWVLSQAVAILAYYTPENTRSSSTKLRAGSPWFCQSAISSVDFAFWGE